MASKDIISDRVYEVTGNRKVIFMGRIFEESVAIAVPIDNALMSAMHFCRPWEPVAMGD